MRLLTFIQLGAGVMFLVSGAINLVNRSPGVGWLFTVLGLIMLAVGAVGLGPKPHTPYSDELLTAGRGVVFWKEGCTASRTLIRRFRRDPRISWVDVRRDPAGEAKLRDLTGGALATPLLLTEDRVVPNPNSEQVAAVLS
ncbi:hypothetical protein GCM10022261_18370 [Brevibacterium daeguense]|uniref:Glutaredoxin n=1 Tax=Brevibacterium daeguense TaxID=909936 RepID=A0ABP8EK11_9MICO|nr:hypothetical protein [Brevibacterium daeguense]